MCDTRLLQAPCSCTPFAGSLDGRILDLTRGNRAKAAKILEISQATPYRTLHKRMST